MFIKYDEYELLELFENEPISVFDKEEGVFIYSRTDTLGFKLVMTISIYEYECNISLSHNNYQKAIFDFKLKDIDSIKCDNEKMHFNRKEKEHSFTIFFRPNFSIDIMDI